MNIYNSIIRSQQNLYQGLNNAAKEQTGLYFFGRKVGLAIEDTVVDTLITPVMTIESAVRSAINLIAAPFSNGEHSTKRAILYAEMAITNLFFIAPSLCMSVPKLIYQISHIFYDPARAKHLATLTEEMGKNAYFGPKIEEMQKSLYEKNKATPPTDPEEEARIQARDKEIKELASTIDECKNQILNIKKDIETKENEITKLKADILSLNDTSKNNLTKKKKKNIKTNKNLLIEKANTQAQQLKVSLKAKEEELAGHEKKLEGYSVNVDPNATSDDKKTVKDRYQLLGRIIAPFKALGDTLLDTISAPLAAIDHLARAILNTLGCLFVKEYSLRNALGHWELSLMLSAKTIALVAMSPIKFVYQTCAIWYNPQEAQTICKLQ
jgi:hypothetical protein